MKGQSITRENYTNKYATTFAHRYDEGKRGIKIRKICGQLPNIKGKTILDLGCGIGFFSNLCNLLGAKVVAMDYADSMIEMSRKRYSQNFPIVQSEVKRLPFKDNSFNGILAFDVLEHLYHIELALKEMQRVLKSKGFIIITTDKKGFSLGSLFRQIAKWLFFHFPIVLQNYIKRTFLNDRYSTPRCLHTKEYRLSELLKLLKLNNFDLKYMDTFPNQKSFNILGGLIEFLFKGFLKRYKWASVIYKCEFNKEGVNDNMSLL